MVAITALPRASDIVAGLRAHEADLRARGVARLWLFGSLARAEGGSGSDIDLLMEPLPDRPFSLVTLASVQAQLAAWLDHEVDLGLVSTLPPGWREQVMHEAMPVF